MSATIPHNLLSSLLSPSYIPLFIRPPIIIGAHLLLKLQLSSYPQPARTSVSSPRSLLPLAPTFLSHLGRPSNCLPFRINFGDLVLLDNVSFSAKVVSLSTGSRFDHVAIIVPVAPHNALALMEATKQGVYAYPFEERMAAHLDAGSRIAVRRLNLDQEGSERPPEFIAALASFVEEHEGKPYERFRNLVKAKLRINHEEEMDHIFCSELVAAALKVVGLMDPLAISGNFQPKDFAQEKIPGLLRASYGPLKLYSKSKSRSRANSVESSPRNAQLLSPRSWKKKDTGKVDEQRPGGQAQLLHPSRPSAPPPPSKPSRFGRLRRNVSSSSLRAAPTANESAGRRRHQSMNTYEAERDVVAAAISNDRDLK